MTTIKALDVSDTPEAAEARKRWEQLPPPPTEAEAKRARMRREQKQ